TQASKKKESAMEEQRVEGKANSSYNLEPLPISNEDILFCIDIDPQSITRFDAIKQSILLFVNAKLTINPQHRFAFATLSNSISSLMKEFSSEVESTIAAVRGFSATTSTTRPDLTTLSTGRPQHQWPENQRLFTLDIMYLHDKPGPDNCPQEVYDTLVDTLEHVLQLIKQQLSNE
ncbi:hypothetical protein RYX36_029285, partial [Vicia faba]